MSLFQLGLFTLASGQRSTFKIDCDHLTDSDWDTVGYLLRLRLPPFGAVEGVPRGGLKLVTFLWPYTDPKSQTLLICDDVYTTGGSMERQRAGRDAIGAVFIARNPTVSWVTPLLVMTPERS